MHQCNFLRFLFEIFLNCKNKLDLIMTTIYNVKSCRTIISCFMFLIK